MNTAKYIEKLNKFNTELLEAYDRYCTNREQRDSAFNRVHATYPEYPLYPEHHEGAVVAKILLDYFSGNIKGKNIVDIGSGSINRFKESYFPAIIIELGAKYTGITPVPTLDISPDNYTEESAGYNVEKATAETSFDALGKEFDAVTTISVLGCPTFHYSGKHDVETHKKALKRIVENFYKLTKNGGINIHFLHDEEYVHTHENGINFLDNRHYIGLTKELFKQTGFDIKLFEIGPRKLIIVTK
ncbi:MAG: hypothetical protein V1870_01645 [Candidatus Aenigmatarchaeota archaeon]